MYVINKGNIESICLLFFFLSRKVSIAKFILVYELKYLFCLICNPFSAI